MLPRTASGGFRHIPVNISYGAVTYSFPLALDAQIPQHCLELGHFKFFFCSVYPDAAETQRMSAEHHVAHNEAAVVNPARPVLFDKDDKYDGCAVKGIKTFLPAADLAVCARKLFSQLFVCDRYDHGCLLSAGACRIQTCLDYGVEVFFFRHIRFEAAYAAPLFYCFYYFVHTVILPKKPSGTSPTFIINAEPTVSAFLLYQMIIKNSR